MEAKEKTNVERLIDNLYEWPTEYYKEAAWFIRKVATAYELSKSGDPNDKDVQHANLLALAAEVKKAIDEL